MKISKQTLFIYNGSINSGYVKLFDLKTLTHLHFNSIENTLKFCEKFNETQCIADILEYVNGNQVSNILPSRLYIDTDLNTKKHRIVNLRAETVNTVSSDLLLYYTKSKDVTNLEPTKNDKIHIKWVVEQMPRGFEEDIARKYTQYQQQLQLIGQLQHFVYKIFGKYVILLEGNSHTDKFVVPPFVTSISMYAIDVNIRKVTITDGVQFIGTQGLEGISAQNIVGGNNIKYIGESYRVYDKETYMAKVK